MRSWATLVLLAVWLLPSATALPEQIHASTVDGGLGIVWARAGDVRSDVTDHLHWWTASGNGTVIASEAYVAPGTTIFTAQAPWPDGVFEYRVGNDRQGWSAVQTLDLAPRNDTWRFVAYGDHGTGLSTNRSILLVPQVQAERPHAVLHLGDLSYANGHAPTWDAWFRLIEPLAASTLYMAAPGNHEHEGYYAASDPDPAWATHTDSITDPYHQFTARLHFGEDDLRYSFDVGPVHVTVINTEDLCVWQPVQYYIPWRSNPTCEELERSRDANGVALPGVEGAAAPPNQDLIDWVRADLAANQDAPWKIVMFHQPVYSAGGYTGRGTLREHYVPLFEEFGVDLVLAGHDHNLQRSFPLRAHAPVTDALTGYSQGQGPIYVVSGGAGEGYYDFRGEQPAWTAVRNATFHYLVIDVREDGLQVQAVEVPTGTVLDTFTIGNATGFGPALPQAPVADRDTPLPWLLLPLALVVALGRRRDA